MNSLPGIKEIREAAERISQLTHRTPLFSSKTINVMCGAEIFFKCEVFQKTGSFKARGAVNAVYSLSDEASRKGVATHSSGNHGAALAYAAQNRGIRAYVVMPENAPAVKKAAVARYGAEIIYCAPNLKAREEALSRVIGQTGAEFIHPFNDYRVIAGQGTAALELFDQPCKFDSVITPIGGGGLISGTVLAVKGLDPSIEVFGVEPLGADDAFRSLKAGRIIPMDNPQTIADGLRSSLGSLTFPIIKENVKMINTVSEEAIVKAMRLIRERMKIVAEPSAAVVLAALLENSGAYSNRKIILVLSGGNADFANLPL